MRHGCSRVRVYIFTLLLWLHRRVTFTLDEDEEAAAAALPPDEPASSSLSSPPSRASRDMLTVRRRAARKRRRRRRGERGGGGGGGSVTIIIHFAHFSYKNRFIIASIYIHHRRKDDAAHVHGGYLVCTATGLSSGQQCHTLSDLGLADRR